MDLRDLDRYWFQEFGDFPPVACELRRRFDGRWFRIHTLPASKRYPDNESEYLEILRQHNAILKDLFGSTDDVLVICCNFSNTNVQVLEPKLGLIGLQSYFWQSIRLDQGDEESSYCHLFVDSRRWKENALDDLLRLVADEEIDNLMLISIENRFLYHPYDGGADLIFKDNQVRDGYKKQYEQWLSARPDSL